jgi:hypothetical protein
MDNFLLDNEVSLICESAAKILLAADSQIFLLK